MRTCLLAFLCLVSLTSFALAEEANIFNPHLNDTLPSKALQGENAQMAQSLGAKSSSLQSEIHYRKFWRQEVYPIVFGKPTAPNEILVFIDYALPQSQNLWEQVLLATKRINPEQTKIVVFAKNSEPYGTELMGGGIWVAYAQPAAALDYFSYTLQRWNAVKHHLSAQGKARPFVHEYDATTGSELPILYAYLEHIQHLVPSEHHFSIVKYAFDAGNINMFQAMQAAHAYDVQSFPAIVVNGKALQSATAQRIIEALQ